MRVAILTFDGFNEIDSFVAAHVLNRHPGLRAEITAPTPSVTSMNGVTVTAQRPLEFVQEADAVIVGSGRRTLSVVDDASIMGRLALDPRRQLVASQCSGVLVLAKLGLLGAQPACTDATTRSYAEAAGVRVLDGAFVAKGNVASAGGCLASAYLAGWILWRLAGRDAAASALRYVAPVGEGDDFVARALGAVGPCIDS